MSGHCFYIRAQLLRRVAQEDQEVCTSTRQHWTYSYVTHKLVFLSYKQKGLTQFKEEQGKVHDGIVSPSACNPRSVCKEAWLYKAVLYSTYIQQNITISNLCGIELKCVCYHHLTKKAMCMLIIFVMLCLSCQKYINQCICSCLNYTTTNQSTTWIFNSYMLRGHP